jgi:hypothetical protein
MGAQSIMHICISDFQGVMSVNEHQMIFYLELPNVLDGSPQADEIISRYASDQHLTREKHSQEVQDIIQDLFVTK